MCVFHCCLLWASRTVFCLHFVTFCLPSVGLANNLIKAIGRVVDEMGNLAEQEASPLKQPDIEWKLSTSDFYILELLTAFMNSFRGPS